MNVLFVCTGNTCRSPMAEALLKDKLPQIDVQSAGLFASPGNKANKHATEVLQQKGITLVHHSQPVTDQLLQWAEVVLTMTTQHKQMLMMQFPSYQEKFYTLTEYTMTSDHQRWKKLREAYADFETKRSLFMREYEFKLDQATLEKKLAKHLSEEVAHIQELESGLAHHDISDPFGGSFEVYQQTFDELDGHIFSLKEKLEKLMGDEL